MEKNDYIVYEAKKWTRGGVDLSPLPPCHDFNQTLTRTRRRGYSSITGRSIIRTIRRKNLAGHTPSVRIRRSSISKFRHRPQKRQKSTFFSSLQRFAKFVPNGGILALEISYRISNRSPKDRERVVRTETKRVNDGRSVVACLHKFEFESIDRSIER